MKEQKNLSQWFRAALAVYLVTLGFAAIAGLVLLSDTENRAELIMATFGFISGSCLSPVILYFFGTAFGSTSKQIAQENLTEKLVNQDDKS